MMHNCVHQDIQSFFLSGTDRNDRDTKHLRKTVKVNLHSPLFHDIHHIQCHDHRFSQFDQLERQIKIPLQCGCIHHIDYHIHVITVNVLTGYFFFHRIGGETVSSRKIYQTHLIILKAAGAFYFFNCDPRPVGYLQIRTRVSIEQRSFPTIGIADKSHMKFFHLPCTSSI